MDQNIYTLLYTNECLHSIEHEFEAASDEVARINRVFNCPANPIGFVDAM